MAGIGIGPRSLRWLHDHHPTDWQRLLQVFPYAEVQLTSERQQGKVYEERIWSHAE